MERLTGGGRALGKISVMLGRLWWSRRGAARWRRWMGSVKPCEYATDVTDEEDPGLITIVALELAGRDLHKMKWRLCARGIEWW